MEHVTNRLFQGQKKFLKTLLPRDFCYDRLIKLRFVSGEQGWESFESARLVLNKCGQGSTSASSYMWVEFVVGSRLASRVFLRVLLFSSRHKNQNTPNSNTFDQHRGAA